MITLSIINILLYLIPLTVFTTLVTSLRTTTFIFSSLQQIITSLLKKCISNKCISIFDPWASFTYCSHPLFQLFFSLAIAIISSLVLTLRMVAPRNAEERNLLQMYSLDYNSRIGWSGDVIYYFPFFHPNLYFVPVRAGGALFSKGL